MKLYALFENRFESRKTFFLNKTIKNVLLLLVKHFKTAYKIENTLKNVKMHSNK